MLVLTRVLCFLFLCFFRVQNAARSVGARLSGEIARRLGNAGLPGDGRITLNFHGVAGQSFGAFCSKGMKLVLRGEAHDYVGKSMHGGSIVLSFQSKATGTPYPAPTHAHHLVPEASVAPHPHPDVLLPLLEQNPRDNVICGNTVLYGATGGRLFAGGRVGERFAVRNSGAVAVVEGTGDNACEYMTNGTAVILGSIGRNFGAGMSGGEAFVLDVADTFLDRYNPGMVEPCRVAPGSPAEAKLKALIAEHVRETSSARGKYILDNWDDVREAFWHVVPNTTPVKKDSQALQHVPLWTRRKVAATTTTSVGTQPLTLRVDTASSSGSRVVSAGASAGFSSTPIVTGRSQ